MARINNSKSATMLRAMRISKGETQDKIAKLLGVTRACVSNYETGSRVPSDDSKVKLAKHFNTTVGYLFYGEK